MAVLGSMKCPIIVPHHVLSSALAHANRAHLLPGGDGASQQHLVEHAQHSLRTISPNVATSCGRFAPAHQPVQPCAMVVLRLHKEVKWATLKLTSVATDITDPARATPGGFIGGEDGTAALAEFAHGWMRLKRTAREQAPTSRVREHHRYMLAQHLLHLGFSTNCSKIWKDELYR